jgi:hypothetical protein
MFLFNYYKPIIVAWLPLLFHIYGIGRTTQNKCDTVNREYNVGNSKMNIHYILICSYVLFVIMSTKLTLSFSKCIRILYIYYRMKLYGRVAFNYITNRTSIIRTFNSQVRNVKDCRDSFGYKRSCAYTVKWYTLAFFVLISVLFYQMLLKWCLRCVSLFKKKLNSIRHVLT